MQYESDGELPQETMPQNIGRLLHDNLSKGVKLALKLYLFALVVTLACGLFANSVRRQLSDILGSFILSGFYAVLVSLILLSVPLIKTLHQLRAYAKALKLSEAGSGVALKSQSYPEVIDEQGNPINVHESASKANIDLPPSPDLPRPIHTSINILIITWIWCWAVELLQITPFPAAAAKTFAPLKFIFGTTYSGLDLFGYIPGVFVGALLSAGILFTLAGTILSSAPLSLFKLLDRND